MTAQKGKDLLLKVRNADDSFITVAGLRARSLSSMPKALISATRNLLDGGENCWKVRVHAAPACPAVDCSKTARATSAFAHCFLMAPLQLGRSSFLISVRWKARFRLLLWNIPVSMTTS